jgi:signal transduction histidine kinase
VALTPTNSAARLADPRFARLNRGLLGFRIALYLAVILTLLREDPPPLLVLVLVFFTFVPALPVSSLRDVRVELGVSISLATAFGLWWLYGPTLAIEVLPLFSLTVSGLLLPRRTASRMLGIAIGMQAAAVFAEVAARSGIGLYAFHTPGATVERLVVTGLAAGVGLGFIELGSVLRAFQSELAERSREEVRLVDLVAHKNNLVNSVAHELRTPLTAVLGFSQALGRSTSSMDEHERSSLARTVAQQSRRLVNAIDNLVVEARSEVTGLQNQEEPVDLIDELETVWKTFDLDERWELSISGAGIARADRLRVRHLLNNLLENAVGAGHSPVRVTVKSRGQVVIGTFHHPIELLVPFGGFGKSTPTENSGLALRAARTLAEAMHGELRYHEQAFELTLPREL